MKSQVAAKNKAIKGSRNDAGSGRLTPREELNGWIGGSYEVSNKAGQAWLAEGA